MPFPSNSFISFMFGSTFLFPVAIITDFALYSPLSVFTLKIDCSFALFSFKFSIFSFSDSEDSIKLDLSFTSLERFIDFSSLFSLLVAEFIELLEVLSSSYSLTSLYFFLLLMYLQSQLPFLGGICLRSSVCNYGNFILDSNNFNGKWSSNAPLQI